MTESWAAAQHDLLSSRVVTESMMHQFHSTKGCYNKAKKDIWHESCQLLLSDIAARSQIRRCDQKKYLFLFNTNLSFKKVLQSICRWKAHGESATSQTADICPSPASCHVTPIWSRWSPDWGWASCGSRPSPGKPANSQKQTQALLFIFAHQRVLFGFFAFFHLSFSRHLPSVTKKTEQWSCTVSITCPHPTVCSCSVGAKKHIPSLFKKIRRTARETHLIFFVADLNSSLFTSLRTGLRRVCESVSGCSSNSPWFFSRLKKERCL